MADDFNDYYFGGIGSGGNNSYTGRIPPWMQSQLTELRNQLSQDPPDDYGSWSSTQKAEYQAKRQALVKELRETQAGIAAYQQGAPLVKQKDGTWKVDILGGSSGGGGPSPSPFPSEEDKMRERQQIKALQDWQKYNEYLRDINDRVGDRGYYYDEGGNPTNKTFEPVSLQDWLEGSGSRWSEYFPDDYYMFNDQSAISHRGGGSYTTGGGGQNNRLGGGSIGGGAVTGPLRSPIRPTNPGTPVTHSASPYANVPASSMSGQQIGAPASLQSALPAGASNSSGNPITAASNTPSPIGNVGNTGKSRANDGYKGSQTTAPPPVTSLPSPIAPPDSIGNIFLDRQKAANLDRVQNPEKYAPKPAPPKQSAYEYLQQNGYVRPKYLGSKSGKQATPPANPESMDSLLGGDGMSY